MRDRSLETVRSLRGVAIVRVFVVNVARSRGLSRFVGVLIVLARVVFCLCHRVRRWYARTN